MSIIFDLMSQKNKVPLDIQEKDSKFSIEIEELRNTKLYFLNTQKLKDEIIEKLKNNQIKFRSDYVLHHLKESKEYLDYVNVENYNSWYLFFLTNKGLLESIKTESENLENDAEFIKFCLFSLKEFN